jgi:hypothetical protein
MEKTQTIKPIVIDERVQVRGSSYLRSLTIEKMAELEPGATIVIQDGDERLLVLMRYKDFMAMTQGQT